MFLFVGFRFSVTTSEYLAPFVLEIHGLFLRMQKNQKMLELRRGNILKNLQLYKLTSDVGAAKLKRNLHTSGRVRSGNEKAGVALVIEKI